VVVRNGSGGRGERRRSRVNEPRKGMGKLKGEGNGGGKDREMGGKKWGKWAQWMGMDEEL